jgi:hypothetical protein
MRPYVCDFCEGISVAVRSGDPSEARSLEDWFESNDGELRWMPDKLADKTNPDVPTHIAQAATEAHQVAPIRAHRSAVLLARGAIEATAKDRPITDGRLYDKIETLHIGGECTFSLGAPCAAPRGPCLPQILLKLAVP